MRRFSFWATVAGVSVLSQFGLEVLAAKTGSAGLAKFTAFSHRGVS